MADPKFYQCEVCGNVVYQACEGGGTMVCCGKPMTELVPNPAEFSAEKHKPVTTIEGDTLTVRCGEADHPMTPEHSIRWIAVTAPGICAFKVPTDEPEVFFGISEAAPLKAFAYCNKHGLWETDIVDPR